MGSLVEHGRDFLAGPTTISAGAYSTLRTISSTNFTGNKKYFLMFEARCTGTASSADEWAVRIKHGSTVFIGSEMRIPNVWAGTEEWYQSYLWCIEFTQPATPEDIVWEGWDVVGDARFADVTTTWFCVDDLNSGDYYYDYDATGDTHGNTFETRAGITFTPANTNDDWLILSWAQLDINHTTNAARPETRLNIDSGTIRGLCRQWQQNLDTDDRLVESPCTTLQLSAASHTINVETRDQATTGSETGYIASAIVAIRLNAFKKYAVSYSAGPTSYGTGAWTELKTVSITPDESGDFQVIGWGVHDAATSSAFGSGNRMQLNGADFPSGTGADYANDYAIGTSGDPADDRMYCAYADQVTLAASAQQFDMDAGFNEGSGSLDAGNDMFIVVFAVDELVAGGDPVVVAAPLSNDAYQSLRNRRPMMGV